MAQTKKLETFEQALDKAVNMLTARFEKADQSAAVDLANALYSVQERERFDRRGREEELTDVPYRA
jgi:hypothetical protein